MENEFDAKPKRMGKNARKKAQRRKEMGSIAWYGLVKPDSISDFGFQNIMQQSADGSLAVTQFSLVDKSPYIAQCVYVMSGPELGYPEATFYVRSNFEYQSTSSQLPNMATPDSSYADLEEALKVVRDAPSFYENFSHVRQIEAYLAKYLPVAGKVGKALVNAFAPQYNGYATLADNIVNQIAQAAAGTAPRQSKRGLGSVY